MLIWPSKYIASERLRCQMQRSRAIGVSGCHPVHAAASVRVDKRAGIGKELKQEFAVLLCIFLCAGFSERFGLILHFDVLTHFL
jgi:hypothetical protein